MKRIITILMSVLLLTSCGNIQQKSDKPTVYASFYAMNDFTETIGGEDIICECIVPAGAEPHDFEPTAADMAKVAAADMFVYSGTEIDKWAEDVIKTLPDTVTVVNASEQLAAEGNDPHMWLSPRFAETQLEQIYKGLSSVDKNEESARKYIERLTEYSMRIDELENEYINANLAGKKLFVTHGAYGYLCADFGMEQVSLEGISGDSDPSPAQMAKTVDQIKAEGARCIYYDPLEGDKLAAAIAREAGIEAFPLCTFEGDSENRDYVTIMKFNLEQLKKGL